MPDTLASSIFKALVLDHGRTHCQICNLSKYVIVVTMLSWNGGLMLGQMKCVIGIVREIASAVDRVPEDYRCSPSA